ncbi:MAG: hypothetical protein O2816_16625, partial [Planctomycetota bacterium]|nr:hypothetical protein [Planctomycetota bacterium]
LNDGLGLVQLYAGLSTHPTDAETFFGGFQDNGSARRTTTGTGWTSVFGGDGGWTQIDQASPSRVFVEYQGTGNLFRSTNGGNSFSDVVSGSSGRNCFLPPFLIDPSDSNRMLYASHQVYRSTNGGSSWSAISGDLTTGTGAIRTLAQSRTNPDVVYAATNDGNVLRSDNGGSNWTLLLSGQPGWPRVTRELTVHPKQPMKVFLAGASHGIDQVRRSGNGGQTWKSLDGDLPDVPVNVIGVHDDGDSEHVFAGSDQGLFYSRGDGKWVRYGRGLPHAVVIDVAIDVARNRIVVATQGRGAWRAPLLLPKAAR